MAILHMMKSLTDTICESFVYETDGAVLVIDGGFETECEALYAKLREAGGKVTGWFFTHPHEDHYGAFIKLMEDHGDEIKVEKLYYHFPTDEEVKAGDPRFFEDMHRDYMVRMQKMIAENGVETVVMKKGDEYTFGDTKILVLREPDPELKVNYINNYDTVFRMDINGKRVMFLGDLGAEAGDQLLETVPAEELKCDYVQMAHHGQNGVRRNVYEAIRADYCLWCTPTWLWDNMGPEGYDTGNFKTVIVRGWMSEIKAKKHYVNMNGPYAIEL